MKRLVNTGNCYYLYMSIYQDRSIDWSNRSVEQRRISRSICVESPMCTSDEFVKFDDFDVKLSVHTKWLDGFKISLISTYDYLSLNCPFSYKYMCIFLFYKFTTSNLPILHFIQHMSQINWSNSIWSFSLNVFSEFKDQDATTVPERHMWETRILNWAQFILRWFIRSPEFTEFRECNESSAPFEKTLLSSIYISRHLVAFNTVY